MKRLGCLTVALSMILWCAPVVAQDEGVDPATQIVGKMQVAVGQLTKLDTGKPTQTTQKQIVEKLDELIAKLEKDCEACRGSRVNVNPNKPAADSTIRNGPGGTGDLHAARKEGKDWGQLPPHERDRILQSMTEGFPPHYQRILERYYKRLAQETPVADAGETSAQGEKTDKSDKATSATSAAPAGKTDTPPEAKPAATPPAPPAAEGASQQ